MATQVRTEIVIDAKPEAVWAVLTDFAGHPEWDPFLASIDGTPALGEGLRVKFRQGMTFRPTVTALEDARTLEWLGKLFIGGLFDGRHRFDLIPENGATRLVHSEVFSGVLVPLLRGALADAERGFVAFNAALKARVEKQAH